MRTRLIARVGFGVWLGLALVGDRNIAAAAQPPNPLSATVAPQSRDIHSFGNPRQIAVRDVALDLVVNPDTKEWKSSAVLTVERQPGCPADAPLILDTRGLTIDKVQSVTEKEGAEIPHRLGKEDPILGAPLEIRLANGTTKVRIDYQISPHATAVQWVSREGTSGKGHGFLYTQSQAIHVRSWIPLQDSPGVRVTYSAKVRVPEGMSAVMSADRGKAEGGVFEFKMPQPIAPYLIALAVGELQHRPTGAQCGVYAETPVIEKAANEFIDTERMVAAAEELCGPYRWGRYDVLVLPPSFPFGGMENAKLTFATPTVIVGDRSLVALVAHELAHSWSGNLVTNATWSDFWLNEGFTTYIERRIVENVFGRERADMEWVLARRELRDELKRFKADDQILHINLKGRDPDDGMTRIPYEKGALFLAALEKQFGRELFDKFLKGYFNHFAFQSITTADFEVYVRANLFPQNSKAAEPVDLRDWLHNPGLPREAPEFRAVKFDAVDAQVHDLLSDKIRASDLKTQDWSTFEWLRFMDELPARPSLARMTELDKALHLTGHPNAEIAEQWLLKAVRSDYKPADTSLESFLTSIGRRKYLVPLYTELTKSVAGKAKARAIYAKARPGYHPIAIESIDKLLGPF
jgi:leukotriene-A4 hydrolase